MPRSRGRVCARYWSASLSRASSSRSHHLRTSPLDQRRAEQRQAPRRLFTRGCRRASRPCSSRSSRAPLPWRNSKTAMRASDCAIRRGSAARSAERSDSFAQCRAAGRSPATTRAKASSCSACAHRAGSSGASSAACRNVCSASGQPLLVVVDRRQPEEQRRALRASRAGSESRLDQLLAARHASCAEVVVGGVAPSVREPPQLGRPASAVRLVPLKSPPHPALPSTPQPSRRHRASRRSPHSACPHPGRDARHDPRCPPRLPPAAGVPACVRSAASRR